MVMVSGRVTWYGVTEYEFTEFIPNTTTPTCSYSSIWSLEDHKDNTEASPGREKHGDLAV